LHGMASRVLAEDERLPGCADILSLHDLVRPAVLHDAVLMDARLVRESIAADDRFVRLDPLARELREQLAARVDAFGRNRRGIRKAILPHAKRHHDLLERRVAGALANAVDRALDLSRA